MFFRLTFSLIDAGGVLNPFCISIKAKAFWVNRKMLTLTFLLKKLNFSRYDYAFRFVNCKKDMKLFRFFLSYFLTVIKSITINFSLQITSCLRSRITHCELLLRGRWADELWVKTWKVHGITRYSKQLLRGYKYHVLMLLSSMSGNTYICQKPAGHCQCFSAVSEHPPLSKANV